MSHLLMQSLAAAPLWFDDRNDLAVVIVRALLLILPLLILVPGFIWWERRLLSWMQDRIGPNRVGTLPKNATWLPKFLRGRSFWGLLQPIADGVKLFFKEDITPAAVDRAIYFIAPAIALFPAFALGATIPWASTVEGPYTLLTPVADVPIGILYLFAISALGVYGVVLAGYASNNKYSLMGGLRASAQLISYELAMGVSLGTAALMTGSLMMSSIVREQETAWLGFIWPMQNWFIMTPFGFVAGVIFAICMVAETNRAPFDLPEAENELIAGYHTEYSSMKFAVFFMGEYAAMFVFSMVFVAVFLGGYNLLPLRWDAMGLDLAHDINVAGAPLWFLIKSITVFSGFIWLRATLPRLRYDQLMSLGWKSLLPLAAFNFIVVSIWMPLSRSDIAGERSSWLGWASVGVAVIILYAVYRAMNQHTRKTALVSRKIELVDPAAPRRSVEMVDPAVEAR